MGFWATKMVWDKLHKNGGGSSDLGPVGYTILAITAAGIVGGAIGITAYNTNKRDTAKDALNAAVATSCYSQGYEVSAVDVSSFECNDDETNHFFKFTGTATNLSGENIEFFSANYLVNANEYKEVVEFMQKKKYKTGFESEKILKKIITAVESSKLVEVTLNENIAVRGIENATDFASVGDESIVLEVSKPTLNNDKVSYNVCYLQSVKTKEGEVGYVTSFVSVEFDATDELKSNPSAVFTLDKSKAKVKIMDRTYSPLKQLDMINAQSMC